MPAEQAPTAARSRDRRPRPPRHRRGRARRRLPAARGAAGVPRARAAVLRRADLAARARRRRRRADLAPLDRRRARRRRRAPPRARRRAPARPRAAVAAPAESRPAVISRIGIGVTLVIAAAIVFLQFTGALAAATDVALAALVVAIAFGVIFAPWFVRLRRRCRPSAPSASARRSAPRSPRTCTTRSCRRSRSCRSAPATRARSPRSRAARSASCAPGCRARPRATPASAGWRPSSRPPRGGRGGARRADRRRRRRRRARWTATARRSSRPRARRCSTRRSSPATRRRSPSTPRPATSACRSSSATAGRASTRRRCRPTGAACASRSSGGWSATAGARRSTPRRAAAPRSSSCSSAERVVTARRAPRVVLVDDHELFRAGVRSELDGLVDVVGDAATVAEAVALIRDAGARRRAARRPHARRRRPRGHPPAAAARRRAGAQFLALSVSDAAEDVIAVIRAGARGYVTKTISGADLADAVRRVHDGDAVFSPRLAGFVLDAFAGRAGAGAPAAGRPRRRARPAHAARARGPAAHRARLHVQGDRAAARDLGEDRRGARLGGAAQAAALQPPRAVALGGRAADARLRPRTSTAASRLHQRRRRDLGPAVCGRRGPLPRSTALVFVPAAPRGWTATHCSTWCPVFYASRRALSTALNVARSRAASAQASRCGYSASTTARYCA